MTNNLIFNRRHPEYAASEQVWRRSAAAYSGGGDYIDQALIRHVSEIDIEFAERRKRAYYFNYPRAIARRITQYVLAAEPLRHGGDPELMEDFSRTGLRVNEVIRQLSTLVNVYGRAWLLVETPSFTGRVDLERARRERLRPYCRALSPLQVVDWAYGNDGRLLWILTAEEVFDNSDPFTPPVRALRRRLIERDRWRLFESDPAGVREIAGGVNPAGEVPAVEVAEPDGFGLESRHWFEDVVRISEAILNNESEAQMNVVKQMFGMLVVSDAFVRGGRKLNSTGNADGNFAATVARSAAIVESVEEKGISRFISPSGVENAAIRAENVSLKRELYDVVGLAVQSPGREAQTAESKAWDFQNVCQFLAARADLLEQAENAAWRLMRKFDPGVKIPQISYNRKFAVRDLAGAIEGLLRLREFDSGPEFRKALRRSALDLLDAVGSVGISDRNKILEEIEHGGMKQKTQEENTGK
ncbi:MAG: hypothetical protein IJS01_12660 [Lentisphaeria bacterium]|nr:hypothetical protein [Lentisphaeria bacterium]